MNTLDAIKTRRAVRSWTDQAVTDEQLTQILEAGRFAPSPLNSHPWHFTVLRSKKTMQQLMPDAKHGGFVTQANVVIVVTVDTKAKVDIWLSEHAQHIYSGACAIQNMWLAAWDMGLGACWVTLDEKATRKVLQIPDDQVIIGSLALGYPKELPSPHIESDRRPLSEMVFYEKYGKTNK